MPCTCHSSEVYELCLRIKCLNAHKNIDSKESQLYRMTLESIHSLGIRDPPIRGRQAMLVMETLPHAATCLMTLC